jgi:hypothetical protein
MALFWFLMALSMTNPKPETSMTIALGPGIDQRAAERLSEALCTIEGVQEAVVVPEDRVAYLKVIRNGLDEDRLRQFQWQQEGCSGSTDSHMENRHHP